MRRHPDGRTKMVGIVGHPVSHSASPAMHNAAFRHLGMNWLYAAFDVPPVRLAEALSGLASAGFAGVNITVPHKTTTAHLLGRLDPAAQKIGAVNTVRFLPITKGFNTDGHGLVRSLFKNFGFRASGKIVAIAGCGGAGRAAAVTLALAGAKQIILLNRTAARARSVARRVRSASGRTRVAFNPGPCHLLINATILGLRPSDPLPLSNNELDALSPKLFMDMVYRPAQTRFMTAMKKRGTRTANGLEMLLQQGARSFEIWTGKKAPIDIMRKALRKEVYG